MSDERGNLITARSTTKFGDCAIAVSGPLTWNSLQTSFRHSISLSGFKPTLKTRLFDCIYCVWSCNNGTVLYCGLELVNLLWRHRNYRFIIIKDNLLATRRLSLYKTSVNSCQYGRPSEIFRL